MPQTERLFYFQYMTPQEKAKELVEKFADKFEMYNADYWSKPGKECALIAIDEILNTHMMFNKSENSGARTFWLNVKKEINKL